MKRFTKQCTGVNEKEPGLSALDIYSRVEDLLGVKEAAPSLYGHYFSFLESMDFDSLIDIGCGSGDFLEELSGRRPSLKLLGIDLSVEMIGKCIERGLPAKNTDLCDVTERYDVATALFDMLNYLDYESLKLFLGCLEQILPKGGLFLCDINTLYGFEEVAVGSYIVDDDERFLAVDSDFSDGVYESEFTLFEKKKDLCFEKSQGIIEQYHHSVEEIEGLLADMKLVHIEDISLYTDEADKKFLVFEKIR